VERLEISLDHDGLTEVIAPEVGFGEFARDLLRPLRTASCATAAEAALMCRFSKRPIDGLHQGTILVMQLGARRCK